LTEADLHFIVPGSLEQRTGGSIYDARVVEGLRSRGWAVVVHELADELATGDGRTRASLAETLLRLPDGARAVIDGLAMAGRPDVVRAQATRLEVLALVHLLAADEPGLGPPERDRAIELEREALAACSAVIATSSFSAGRVMAIGVDPARVRTVRPGTDPAPAATGPGHGAPPRLLCVASVTPGKGQDVLVRALTRLADLPWSCVCAGSLTRSPAFARMVQALVQDAGSSGRIALPGECDANTIEALYATSSIFVLPSFYEAYGMALTEAMARGLPIVTTTGGGIADTVPGEAGILVPPGDEAALAGALRLLLADAPNEPGGAGRRRAQLGAAAREHAFGLPDWDLAVDAFAEAVTTMSPPGSRGGPASVGPTEVRSR